MTTEETKLTNASVQAADRKSVFHSWSAQGALAPIPGKQHGTCHRPEHGMPSVQCIAAQRKRAVTDAVYTYIHTCTACSATVCGGMEWNVHSAAAAAPAAPAPAPAPAHQPFLSPLQVGLPRSS